MKSREWCLLVGAFLLTGSMSAQTGQFGDFTYESDGSGVTITGYACPGGPVVIPNTIDGLPVTSIGYRAFWYCAGLTSLSIPDSVTSLGEFTFQGCTGLTSITIPDSVTNIQIGAFYGCTSLTSVTIPGNGATSIEISAFQGCSGLTGVTIGKGVMSVDFRAFDACTSLTAITVEELNPVYSSLEGVVFDKNQTTLMKCPEGRAGTYKIPHGVTSIGRGAFNDCSGLTSVTIPDGVTSIEGAAFRGCTSLTSVTIPHGVTSIGWGAFWECSSLTSVTIPHGVMRIEVDTFRECSSLTSVSIPDTVTSIGRGAFNDCNSLTSVTIPHGVTSIEGAAFSRCTSLTRVTIPDSVTSIGELAFNRCTGLTSVTIGNGVTSIGDYAFYGCTGLTTIMIPDSVTSIGQGAFSGCSKLTLKISSGVMSIAGWNLANVGSLAAIEVDPSNPVYSSVDGVLYDKNQTTVIMIPRGKLGSVTVPGSVTSIADEAFKDCAGLKAVYFLGNAPAHAADAFANTPATLFYVAGSAGWESTLAGRPTVSWNGLFGAQSLEMYAGLTILGEIGQVYSVEYVADLTEPAESDWRCLEYLQLPASPYLWVDKSASAKRFYRAVAMEPPENMVFIPPGTFRMGSPADEVDRYEWEGPQTEVTISRGYWMGKYEVTQGEYESVMGSNPSYYTGDLNLPVESVTWDDVTSYCVKLTERERLAGRIAPNAVYGLPTEAEWEYACRAWTSTRFSYGDDPGYTNLINYGRNRDGQNLPNPWELYDMHGSVSEWCQDWYGEYLGGIALDPQGPASGSYRVIRGGSGGLSPARDFRSAFRGGIIRGTVRSSVLGFRVVLVPGQP